MDHVQQAKCLRDAGLFRDALTALDGGAIEGANRIPTNVLRAEILERVGRYAEAQTLVKSLFSTRSLTWSDRSTCDFVLARIAIARSDFETAVSYLTRSVSCAQRAGDTEKLCYSQLKLALQLADGAGTDAIGPLLAEARTNAIKTGEPRVMATVHVYIAQIEALRGSTVTSRRHINLAKQLLKDSPNAWLEAITSNLELTLALVESEFECAKKVGRLGLQYAQQSGSALELAVNRSNSGLAFEALGEFEEAETCFEQAMKLFVRGSEGFNGTADSLARVRIAQGRLEDCEELLEQIDPYNGKGKKRPTYIYRHILSTRALLWIRKGNHVRAQGYISTALKMSREACDPILTAELLIEQTKLFLKTKRFEQALSAFDELRSCLPDQSAEVHARFQDLLGSAAKAENRAGRAHFERAARILTGLHNREADGAWKDASEAASPTSELERIDASSTLQSIITILSYHRHPEVVALELLALLESTTQFTTLIAVACDNGGQERVLLQRGSNSDASNGARLKRLRVGETTETVVELRLLPKNSIESLAALQAASTLLQRSRDLRVARDERNERSTPWPIDLNSSSKDEHVLSGHMRELMMFAQRVARTNVTVLITGESGTGKEILARAIHEFSSRSKKPFVPFNCSAVPRDLLESQLFGHRRGAFTGADRDQLGLIRSAVDGTLFLDEVGDMSLDLQPKLLRFLESGEVSPLGEPSPFNVNVRIVAATNANLDDAVRDGKFREDLFYRLNVVRLAVKPLRERRDEIPAMVNQFVIRAAREHQKGHILVSEDTMERLLLYRWPGNVRQLQNEVNRMVAMADPNSTLEPDLISTSILEAMPNLRHIGINGREIAIPLQEKLLPTLARIEYEMIKAALHESSGRLEPAAKSLGISRKGLYLKRQRFGL